MTVLVPNSTELIQSTSTPRNGATELSVCVDSTIIWEYGDADTGVTDLYELAKAKAWNAAKDVNWTTYSRSNYPTIQEGNPLAGFPAYEVLAEAEKIRVSWWQHSLEISEILHGEQGALLVAAQLVDCLPTVEAKLFASSQVFDEARHVEFFSRYLKEIVGEVQEPSPALKSLIEGTLADRRWDMKFIACQVLIESLAMAKFQEIKRTSKVPILQQAIAYVAKDEARHVNFGTEFLKSYLVGLSSEEIESRSKFVLDGVIKLSGSLNIYTRIAESLGWDTAALRHHLRKYRVTHPDINRNRFRQLTTSLKAVGLMTERARARLASMNLLN